MERRSGYSARGLVKRKTNTGRRILGPAYDTNDVERTCYGKTPMAWSPVDRIDVQCMAARDLAVAPIQPIKKYSISTTFQHKM